MNELARVDATGHDTSGTCANCGAALSGPFCARCGQPGHVHRTMTAFLHDVLHGVFHFEGKFWATLPMLALRPGELTRRYAAGERAKFVSPIGVFLFSVFLLFAVVANIPFLDEAGKLGRDPGLTRLRVEIAEQRREAEADVRKAAAALVAVRGDGSNDARDRRRAEARLSQAQASLAALRRTQRVLPPPGTAAAGTEGAGTEGAGSSKPSGWVQEKLEHARANPDLVAYKIKSSAYKFSWALIPLSLPFIWLLFPRRRDVGMYDHAVFGTYSLAFMSLIVVAATLLRGIGVREGLVSLAMASIVPWHMYRQLKGAYGFTRGGALWRTGWLLLFAAMAGGLFVSMLTYMGTT